MTSYLHWEHPGDVDILRGNYYNAYRMVESFAFLRSTIH
jgi:hypothetical protein